MKEKIIDFFFEEEEKELVEDYAFLLNVAAVSAVITFITIIL